MVYRAERYDCFSTPIGDSRLPSAGAPWNPSEARPLFIRASTRSVQVNMGIAAARCSATPCGDFQTSLSSEEYVEQPSRTLSVEKARSQVGPPPPEAPV